MRLKWVLPAAVAIAVVSAAITAAVAVAHSSSTSAQFSDKTSDNGTAPDIGSVTATADGTGNLTFRVNLVAAFPGQSIVSVYIDSDGNASTGEPHSDGADYVLDSYQSDNGFDYSHWNGSTWDDSIPYSSVHVSNDPGGVTFTVNRSDMPGAADNIHFWVESVENENATGSSQFDDAPDTGTWSYSFLPLKLTMTNFLARASKGTLVAVGSALRSDDGQTVGSDGAVACKASAGGKALKLRTHGLITVSGATVWACGWTVSASVKGKLAHGQMTVTDQGVSVVRTFSTKLK